jgi:uncharacterized protein YciI
MKYIDTRMFVVLVRYTQPTEVVMVHLSEHRMFVERQYACGTFIASGRGAEGDPGVYIASGVTRQELQELIKGDAFHQHSVAEYEIVEFHASRVCDALGQLFPSAPPLP